jgi:plastocyanin
MKGAVFGRQMSGSQSSRLTLVLAIVAIVIALGSVAYAYVATASISQSSTSISIVNQAPQTRHIIMEWEATLPSLQDRFLPQQITVNQGDTISLYLEINDTDGAHTFTINAPTGPGGTLQLTQVNLTWPGQWMYYPPRQPGPMNGTESKSAPTNCYTMGKSVPCNTTGGCSINGGPITNCVGSWMLNSTQHEIATISATVAFGPLVKPGVYEYYCVFHEAIGMFGYLIVLPNKGYTG